MSWGTNRAGVPWLIDPSYEDDFEVSLARGRVRPTAVGAFRMAFLPYALPFADLTVNVQVDQAAIGERINAIVAVRSISEDDEVQARVEFRTDGTYSISLYDVVSGSYTSIGFRSSIATYTPSNPVMVRLQVSNGNARLKTWAVATPEPDHWQVSGTTQVPGPGRIGLGAILSDGNTNTDPEVSFGALQVPNPQQFRVTRSVNRVVKPHAAGTDVRLAHPSVVAL